VRTFANADCQFGYRQSRFKGSDQHVILEVRYQLGQGALSEPVAYEQLAARLDIDMGERAPLADVREAVLQLRRSKGMVLDSSDHDTWSAGSFFTNPVLDATGAARLPEDAPRWPMPDEHVKTSAAWLIQRAGFQRGYESAGGRASLSTKHTLALTNRGDAAASDVLKLAREIRDGVVAKFGVVLQPEPMLIGCAL
jgi:UDP-N-acetylmuramate dehydrogenase